MTGIMAAAVGQELAPPTVTLDQTTIFSPDGTSPSVTATPSGGLAPYTYAWTNVSGATFVVGSPTSATTTFTGSDSTGTYRCTVTDAAGHHGSADVTITFFNGGFP